MAFSAVTAGLFWQNGTEDLAPKTSPESSAVVEPQPEPQSYYIVVNEYVVIRYIPHECILINVLL